MSTLAEIEAATDTLSELQKQELLEFLAARLGRKVESAASADTSATASVQPRIAGMHAGAWELAPDFDDPLPDEFWLGKDAFASAMIALPPAEGSNSHRHP